MGLDFHGQWYSRSQITALVGDVRQLVDVVPVLFEDGPARGMRGLIVRVAGGMSFDVLVDRGMDVGQAVVGGMPLAWKAPGGLWAPAFAESSGSGWTRTFGGGLVTTCGMMNVGAAGADDGENLGLHGRVSHLPADEVSHRLEWLGDELEVVVEGRVVESDLGGPTLERRRIIRARVGVSRITLEDVVTNIGAVDAPHMYRFHVNFGFPLIRPGDEISTEGDLAGWRTDAPPASQPWTRLGEPSPGMGEEVLYINPGQARAGTSTVTVRRPGAGAPHVSVEWSRDTLPVLVLWKFQRSRTNVLGIEPSTCRDEGRAAARTAKELVTLAPDESRSYCLRIDVNPASATAASSGTLEKR